MLSFAGRALASESMDRPPLGTSLRIYIVYVNFVDRVVGIHTMYLAAAFGCRVGDLAPVPGTEGGGGGGQVRIFVHVSLPFFLFSFPIETSGSCTCEYSVEVNRARHRQTACKIRNGFCFLSSNSSTISSARPPPTARRSSPPRIRPRPRAHRPACNPHCTSRRGWCPTPCRRGSLRPPPAP